jgi:photosystem II oxygen-evolving enhancer protein 3
VFALRNRPRARRSRWHRARAARPAAGVAVKKKPCAESTIEPRPNRSEDDLTHASAPPSLKHRQAVSLAVAGVVAFSAMPALALNQIELQDKRVTNKEGLQLIYEARDLNIAESTRQDGPSRFAFQKLNSNQTKARATESLNRINKDVPEYVEKAYWSQAGMELRRQLNTMRFDINNLVDEKGGDRTQAKKFYQAVEALDFQIRSKDKDGATAAVATVQDLGNALLASLV